MIFTFKIRVLPKVVRIVVATILFALEQVLLVVTRVAGVNDSLLALAALIFRLAVVSISIELAITSINRLTSAPVVISLVLALAICVSPNFNCAMLAALSKVVGLFDIILFLLFFIRFLRLLVVSSLL